MSFQNLSFGRIIQTVVLIWVVSLLLGLMGSCLREHAGGYDQTVLDAAGYGGQSRYYPDELNAEVKSIRTVSLELNLQYGVQWGIAVLTTLWFARRAARRAATPAQAAGTGLVVGLGVAFTYGVVCVIFSLAMIVMRLVFFVLLLAAGVLGGMAGPGPICNLPRRQP